MGYYRKTDHLKYQSDGIPNCGLDNIRLYDYEREGGAALLKPMGYCRKTDHSKYQSDGIPTVAWNGPHHLLQALSSH